MQVLKSALLADGKTTIKLMEIDGAFVVRECVNGIPKCQVSFNDVQTATRTYEMRKNS